MFRTVFVLLNILLGTFVLGYFRVLLAKLDPSGDLPHLMSRVWGLWILASSGARVRVEGRENVLMDRPQIFFSNHASYFDVFCLLAHLPCQFRWLAKVELFRIPFFGKVLAYGGYLPIDRSNARAAHRSMVEAAKRIAAGSSIVIFPEGTRSPDGVLQEFKSGGAVLAIRAQVPVVPVAIVGTHRIMPKGTLRIRPGRVEVRIGQPIPTEGMGARDRDRLLARARDAMSRLLQGPQAGASGEGPASRRSA
jgi:1-acyl-sn-glycerol-3-phosphate acyltransferase